MDLWVSIACESTITCWACCCIYQCQLQTEDSCPKLAHFIVSWCASWHWSSCCCVDNSGESFTRNLCLALCKGCVSNRRLQLRERYTEAGEAVLQSRPTHSCMRRHNIIMAYLCSTPSIVFNPLMSLSLLCLGPQQGEHSIGILIPPSLQHATPGPSSPLHCLWKGSRKKTCNWQRK